MTTDCRGNQNLKTGINSKLLCDHGTNNQDDHKGVVVIKKKITQLEMTNLTQTARLNLPKI